MNPERIDSMRRQRGAATLLMALVIMTSITLISLYTSRSVLMEQKITTNDYRGRMAFEAAEAAIDSTVAYIKAGRDRDGDELLPGGINAAGTSVADPNEFLFTTTNTLTLASGASAEVTLRDLSNADGVVSTEIVATGHSDDGAATRIITQIVTKISPLPNIPENPLLTRGSITVNGAADIYNPEGHSTIWSGGPVDLSTQGTTSTEIADPNGADYPNCLGDSANACTTTPSTSDTQVGVDVIEQDSSLANLTSDEFFENFFGMSPTEYRNRMVTMDLAGADINDAHLSTNEVIWVEGDATVSANKTFGCATQYSGTNHCTGNEIQPVIMIVNGTLTMQGNADFFGLLYIMDDTDGNGTPYNVGSVIVAGDSSNLTGNFNITYNSDVLRQTSTDAGAPAASGGSWRDF